MVKAPTEEEYYEAIRRSEREIAIPSRLRDIRLAILEIQKSPNDIRNQPVICRLKTGREFVDRTTDLNSILLSIESVRDIFKQGHFEVALSRLRGIDSCFALANARLTQAEVTRSRRSGAGAERGHERQTAIRGKKWALWADEVQKHVEAGTKLTTAYVIIAELHSVSDRTVADAYRAHKKKE